MEAAASQHGGAGVIDLEEGSGSGGAPLSPPLSPASAAAAALANARWNPTKEQLAALEGLYEHGLRTPNAEQIKQITARLREHGNIEGKNVFYWFQNHKARQRQKQRQDSFDYFSRLLRRPPPLPMLVRPPGPLPYRHCRLPVPATPAMAVAAAPPPAAAACSNTSGGTHVMYRAPFYMPAPPQAPAPNALYYHPHQHQQQVPAPVMYPMMEVAQDKMIPVAAEQLQHHRRRRGHNQAAGAMYHAALSGSSASTTPMHVLHFPPAAAGAAADAGPSRETLQLFPLQPTFLLPADKGRAAAAGGGGASMASTASASFSGESESMEESPDSSGEALVVPFYDFFGLQSGGR